MEYISRTVHDGIARVVIHRGKVNALNDSVIDEMSRTFGELALDPSVRAIILTGTGKFFSFGFDIPQFLGYGREQFTRYLTNFTGLYREIFLHPKPVVAMLNGHTIAGACMIASSCDYRVMVSGKARISLNEINFGSSVFAGSVEMLKLLVGPRNAESVLYGGAMYSAEEALRMGLIDQVVSEADLEDEAGKIAREYAARDPDAFRSIKGLLRRAVAEQMERTERDSIEEFVRIWYSEKTWGRLQGKTIHA
ncbi:MAG TPA: enoyl-CoA hydratase/isomerase family protein [Syntrophales bacterium]|nr:enoyl-CoA hydratase/isomerase family protein [Syntrophales bacterium]